MSKEEYNAQFKYVPVGAYVTIAGDFSVDQYGNYMNIEQFATSYPLIATGNIFSKNNGAALESLHSTFYVLDEETNIISLFLNFSVSYGTKATTSIEDAVLVENRW